MSLTIATQNRRYTVKTGEEESEQLFEQLLLSLLEPKGLQLEIDDTGRFQEVICSTETRKIKSAIATALTKIEINPEVPAIEDSGTYSGFMYIECPHCGEIKAFCTKEQMTSYRCQSCQEKTEFEGNLKRMYLRCECGKRSTYWTNMSEYAFDVNCIECGNPVPIKYNEKKDLYETIR